MNFLGVVMNVADLDRSIDFYREVLGFTLVSQEVQLAVVGVSSSDTSQAIVLRALGSSPLVGAGHVGLRSFILAAESADQLDRFERELESRRLLITRREHTEWTAVVGRDPDGVAVVDLAAGRGHPGRLESARRFSLRNRGVRLGLGGLSPRRPRNLSRGCRRTRSAVRLTGADPGARTTLVRSRRPSVGPLFQ